MNSWDKLSMAERAEIIKLAVEDGIYNLDTIRNGYNEFAEGGDTKEEDITPWKALDNIDYTAIPDTTFTRDKTGAGSIEVMFNNTPEEGYEYGTGYKYPHPLPGHNVVIYNPKDNDAQDIRLDALHIMPQDATYDALRSELAFYADNSDIANSARSRMKEDISKYGHVIPGMTYQDYFNNEVDGFLRNMFIEGSPEYIESKRYYPNKQQLREWNEHLMPYVDRIHNYLITGEKPANILPEIIIYGKKHSMGGPIVEAAMNEYKHGGGIHIKPSHRGRLTELKKRTGKTEAELYRTGGPAVRKMITFARNARKWKHGLGGNLFDGTSQPTQKMKKASDYRYVLDDDGEWNRVANDEMGRVFQGLTVTPKKTKQKFIPERIDNSLEAAKAREKFFQYRDEEGHIKGEPGLEIVSPEFEVLMGARMAMPTYSQEATRNYKIAKSFKADTKRMPSINSAFRNEEWSNFLSTRNGDNYYRLVDKSREAYSPKEKYFVSHTTPWEEFSGLGTKETIGTDRLYEFPTETFGTLRSSTSRGLPTEFDVTEMGRQHLLYGSTSSGVRGPVRVLSDKNAAILGESPFKIGIVDRPTLESGLYENMPIYEQLGMGNQTVLKGSTLERNINDATYNIFERTPFGILKTLHVGK